VRKSIVGGELLEEVLTLEALQKALTFKLEKRGMTKDNIDKLAEYLMNFFGYDDYVSDNKLSSKDRDVFYMLEEEGLLKTLRDEVTIQKGKVWRIHYWVLKKHEILKLSKMKHIKDKKEDKYKIYDDLSEEVWQSHHKNNSKVQN